MANDTIFVKAASPTEVALFERDPAHPGGEIFVAGSGSPDVPNEVVEAAETGEVLGALREGRVVKLSKTEAEKERAEAAKLREARRREALAAATPIVAPAAAGSPAETRRTAQLEQDLADTREALAKVQADTKEELEKLRAELAEARKAAQSQEGKKD